MNYPNLSIDLLRFTEALREVILNPVDEVDTDTAAARKATGLPNLDLTPEQRRQCKQAGFGAIYGIGTEALMKALGKK